MFLFRWLFTLLFLCAVLWFATMVPLGKRTLWGHLRAIFATQPAKDLAEGAKEEARKVAERLRDEGKPGGAAKPEGKPDGAAKPEQAPAPPLDPVGPSERKRLDRLVRERTRGGKLDRK